MFLRLELSIGTEGQSVREEGILFKPEGHWGTLMPLESLLRFTPLEEMEGV